MMPQTPMSPSQFDVFARAVAFIRRKFRVTTADLEGSSRVAPVVLARHCLIAILRANARMTMRQIGLLLNRDTSAIAHAMTSLQNRSQTDREFRAQMEALASEFWKSV